MLLIQVNDAQLEAQLTRQAAATGKPTQQLVEELLTEALKQVTAMEFSFPRLDPKRHSKPLQLAVDPSTDDAPVFQHVGDTAEFAKTLRQNAWKR
ncbi:MAG: hypothetical protein EOO39_19160 [Cytophagaceae bacterium]|nr:MAG: hypothetical protein EOO39_19160 [Cytophagaceae bacterium]